MKKTLSEQEIEGILRRVRPMPLSYYWSAVIGVMAYAGLSDLEVIELLNEDLDLTGRVITVTSPEDVTVQRAVAISDELFEILENHTSDKSDYLFSNIQANGKKWFKSSFDRELAQRLPRDLEASQLTDSYGKL